MILNIAHTWDMHCHSHFSDGRLGLADLFQLAASRGIENLALTDHDTAAGYRSAVESQSIPENLTLHPAAELSCIWKGRTVHIVALGIDAFGDEWRKTEADYNQRRTQRLQRIITLLSKKGLTVDQQRLQQMALPALPARPHIADFLVQTGQVKSFGAAFKKWLGQGKPGDVKQQWPSLEETVDAIHRAGGIAVIAHPHKYKLTWTKARELLDDFQQAGGQGIEISCIGLHPDLRKFLIEQARQRQMWVGGGSDFHSPNAQWIQLGHFPPWPSDVQLVKDWVVSNAQSR